jgi:EpsI family protein
MVSSKKLLIVFGILAISLVPRFLFTGVRTLFDERPVEFLPDEVREWQAVEVFVCPRCLVELKEAVWNVAPPKNPAAQMFYLKSDLSNGSCPVHKIPLTTTKDLPVDFMTQKVLSAGTEFLEKWYRNLPLDAPSGRDLFVTIVTTGAEKRGIHRPERCFQAQGWQVVSRARWRISPLGGSQRSLEATRLVVRRVWLTPEGKKAEAKEVVFYWFMGHNRLTGRNLKRLLYTALDRVLRGLNYRWSCVQLNSPVRDSVEETSRRMGEFVWNLLPLIQRAGRRRPE